MKLLGDVPSKQFDIVVVHTLDRWARKLKNQIHALDILAKKELPPLKIEDKAEAVKGAFQISAEGQSDGKIATWLNNQGFRTLEGNHFTAHAVRDILNNHYF